MTTAEARAVIAGGGKFGDVYPLLESDAERDALKEWFVRAEGVPASPVRAAPPPANGGPAPAPVPRVAERIKRAKEEGYSGDPCTGCGGWRLVRSGACLLCLDCHLSSGCS